MKSDNFNSTPLHLLFSSYLERKIDAGYFPQGSFLPSSTDLMSVFKLKLSDVLKAMLDLKERGIVEFFGNTEVKVIADNIIAESRMLDVKNDINEIFELSETLEHIALDCAWTKIDSAKMREFLILKNDSGCSQWIWRVNMGIHSQIVDNCVNRELLIAISVLNKQLEFFRQLYLSLVPEKQALNYALLLESIISSFISGEREKVHNRISACFYIVQKNLLEFFREKFTISSYI